MDKTADQIATTPGADGMRRRLQEARLALALARAEERRAAKAAVYATVDTYLAALGLLEVEP